MSKEEFKILNDREHALQRPSMYIGSVDMEPKEDFILGKWTQINRPPGLIKIINEVIDNSLDEAIRTKFKHASIIKVDVGEYEITVSDDGRGIPQEDAVSPDGSVIPRPEAAWTQTKAGSNFSDERSTVGMNGLGAALTNFYSRRFVGTTCDGKTTYSLTCVNNGNVAESFTTDTPGAPSGTTVTFMPDFDRFEEIEEITDDISAIIHDRITSLQIAYPEIKFYFNGKRIAETTILRYSRLYSDIAVVHNTRKCSFFFTTTEDGFRQRSYVNGAETTNGGKHIDFIIDNITAELIPLIKRKYRVDVTRSIVQQNLTLVAFLRDFNNPKFDSQTKERLTNSTTEVREYMEGVDFPRIARNILNQEEIVGPIVDALVARMLANERREQSRKARELQRKKVDGHIRAFGKAGSGKKMLCLAEGLSAIGRLLDTRDPEWIGGLPLKGVVMNVHGQRPVDVMKNAELSNIMAVLGLVIGQKAENLEYDKIAIMVDADVDGGKIAALLINFFYTYWPELFEEKRVSILRTPSLIATKGKQTRWFYTENEASAFKANSKGWSFRYIKGLASLTHAEFKEALNNPVLDVIQVDDPSLLELVFGPDADRRKLWLMGEEDYNV